MDFIVQQQAGLKTHSVRIVDLKKSHREGREERKEAWILGTLQLNLFKP